jgi:hypothetical protein
MAGKEPIFQEWDGNGSLTNRIVSDNWHRRHLNETQRAFNCYVMLRKLGLQPEKVLKHQGFGGPGRIRTLAKTRSLVTPIFLHELFLHVIVL